jgi:thiamine kinase-like enzyme
VALIKNEAAVFAAIKGRALCDDPVYINPENGYKITRFISDARPCDSENEEDLQLCMKKLRGFHEMRLSVPHEFSIFGNINFYEQLMGGSSMYRDYEETKKNVFSLIPFIEQNISEKVLCHIDSVPDNFLFDPHTSGELGLQLTDWEYAGMQDPHVDIAMFWIYSL